MWGGEGCMAIAGDSPESTNPKEQDSVIGTVPFGLGLPSGLNVGYNRSRNRSHGSKAEVFTLAGKEVWLERMTSPWVKEAIKQGCTTALVAVGSNEQHGPHLVEFFLAKVALDRARSVFAACASVAKLTTHAGAF